MADQVVDEIKDAGGRAVANYDSVAEPEGAENIIKTALDEFGKVDGVVSNAGILRDGTFHKMEFENWDAVLKVHLYGGYNVIRAAWPHFREQSYGRVVVATSTSGLFGNFGQANYSAAKLGLVGLINTLAQEGAKYNIKANAVAPIAATRMTRGHPAAGGVREADARIRRAGGGVPVHRGGPGDRRRCSSSAAARCSAPRCSRTTASHSPVCRQSTTSPGSGARSPICRRRSRPDSSSADRSRMKALVAQELSGPSGLAYTDVDDVGGDDAVVIDVGAAGVCFPDLLLLRGEYQLQLEPPFIPGMEVAGVVRSAPDESGFKPGQRVTALTMLGGWAERVAVPPANLMPTPDEVDDAEAVALLGNYHTMYFALARRGALRHGETVLVLGSAGGVGTASVQIAKAMGAG